MKTAPGYALGLVCLLAASCAAATAAENAPAATAPGAATATASPAVTPSPTAPGNSADPSKAAAPTFDEVMKDPQRKVGFLRKRIAVDSGAERIYQVWVPLGYTASPGRSPASPVQSTAEKKWPVILFLHGLGESGRDGDKPLTQGLPKEIAKRQGKFDFIVVIPQVAGNFGLVRSADGGRLVAAGGWGGPDGDIAMEALARTLREYSCDADRVYLTGLSMGGYGTYTITLRHPKPFAAIVPICGGGDPATGDAIGRLPIWIWHGDADRTVPVANSREIVTGLVKAKAIEMRYTELPGVGHNSWDNAYASDELYKWLLAHKRSDLETATPVKPIISAPGWDKAPKTTEPEASKTAEPDARKAPEPGRPEAAPPKSNP